MSFYPDVNPGQNFEPSAQLENDVRRLVNRGGLSGVRANGGGVQVENICINAYNPGTTAIAAGAVVTFLDAAMVEGCVQVVAMASGSADSEWGIVQEQIESHQFGSVLVMGAVVVPISGSTGDYAVPSGGGASFTRSATGVARILRLIGSTSALILVGSSSGGGGTSYDAGDGINSDLLSGGTISTNLVEGNNIHIVPVEGSTNGAMEISADGGGTAILGFPNYNGSKTYISASAGNTYINTFTDNRWIIGTIGFPTSNNMTGTVQIYVGLSNISPATDFGCLEIGQTTLWGFDMPFTIPLPKNTQIQIYATDNAYVNAYAYPCL